MYTEAPLEPYQIQFSCPNVSCFSKSVCKNISNKSYVEKYSVSATIL